jgi:hypothetical protein
MLAKQSGRLVAMKLHLRSNEETTGFLLAGEVYKLPKG